jgi:hypothetical protein
MSNSPNSQLASAESLLDSAAELIMDAAELLKDAGESEAMQDLEELAVSVSHQGTILKKERGAHDEVAPC